MLLRRFPDEQSGLPYWDRMLPAETREHGPKSARIIAHTMTRQWDEIVGYSANFHTLGNTQERSQLGNRDTKLGSGAH